MPIDGSDAFAKTKSSHLSLPQSLVDYGDEATAHHQDCVGGSPSSLLGRPLNQSSLLSLLFCQ